MLSLAASKDTLAMTIWPVGGDSLAKRIGRTVLLAVVGSLLLWATAKVQVPFYPVPMTMQPFAVLVIGMAYGWRLGAATILLYLAEGAMGLPVFAGTPEKGLGLAYMAGSTGGYLAERGWDRRAIPTALAMLIGTVLIYIPGLIWLGILFGWDKPILTWGLTPFLLGDVTKVALAAAVLPLSWRMIDRQR